MHLHGGELGEDLGHVLELGPVELQVLARREMPVGAVVLARDLGELAQLPRGKQPVGDGDAQHRRIALDVQAVAQAQRAELFLRELAGHEAARLVAELRDPLVHQALIELVIDVHGSDRSWRAYDYKDYCVRILGTSVI